MRANLVPTGDLGAVEDVLKRYKNLEFDRKITLSALDDAARNFLLNRHLDDNSPTVGKVRTTLEGLTLRSRSKLAANIANLRDFVVDMLFGEAPGATVALSVNGGVETQSERNKSGEIPLLHSAGPAAAESIKTLWRHGDGAASPTGQVLVRRLNIVAGWIPENAAVDDLARLLAGIMTIIEGSPSSEPARERQLLGMAHRLIVAGSFGSRALYSSLISGLAKAEGLNGRLAFVSGTIPLVLADFQDHVGEFGGHPARDLACLIVEEYVKQAELGDCKQLLTLLSKCFPAAFVNQVRQACDRLDRQYRIVNPQQRRKKTRGWTHPHATWQLISDVLDVIWPAQRGPLPEAMKDRAKELLDEVLLYADAGLPSESDIGSDIPSEAIYGPGRSDRNGVFVTANNMINREHVEQVGLWRAHIWKLDSALLRLDREILFDLDPRSETDPSAKAEAHMKRGYVDVLQTWRLAGELVTRSWQAVDQSAIIEDQTRIALNFEQKEAALAATDRSAIVIVEGAPGSGKTTMLAPVVDAYRSAGLRVVGAATAWRVANALRNDLGIESRATASWMEHVRRGKKFLDRDSVLVVDEAGLLSSREMHALLSEVHRAEAKLILVGDRRQLQAIGAGPGLDLVARVVDASHVDTIVRQRQEWARAAVLAFGRGDAQAGLEAFADHGQLVEAKNHRAALDRIVSLRREWTATGSDENFLIIARTNAQVAEISRAIRRDLRQAGRLKGPDFSIPASTPSGHETRIELAAGDRIRFLARNDELGVVNGTIGTVTKVAGRDAVDDTAVTGAPAIGASNGGNRQSEPVRIEATVDGRRIDFTPGDLVDDKGRARLGWAYATTVYGAQGMTVDHAAVLLDPAFDRHAVHVAASRARETTTLIVDRSAIDMRLATDRPLDQQDESLAVSDAERRKWLADRLSRANIKSSTYDTHQSLIGQTSHQPEGRRVTGPELVL